MSFVPVILGNGSKIAAGLLGAGTQFAQGNKQAGELSKEILGYDFVGLITKLVVYFSIAYIFAKFMEFIIYSTGFFKWFVEALGLVSLGAFKINDPPKILTDLFVDGYNGVKYWDLIKGIAIILVGVEAYMYYKSNKALGGQPSPLTLGIFAAIESGLVVITVPELLDRLQNKPVIEFSANSAQVGGSIAIRISNLKPNTTFVYGWKELNYELEPLADANGQFKIDEMVQAGTAPGAYTIYADQTKWGGKANTARFTVLGGIAA